MWLRWPILKLERILFSRENSASAVVRVYSDFPGQTCERELLREKAVVLECDHATGGHLVEDVSKVYKGRREGHSIHREHTEQ